MKKKEWIEIKTLYFFPYFFLTLILILQTLSTSHICEGLWINLHEYVLAMCIFIIFSLQNVHYTACNAIQANQSHG